MLSGSYLLAHSPSLVILAMSLIKFVKYKTFQDSKATFHKLVKHLEKNMLRGRQELRDNYALKSPRCPKMSLKKTATCASH